MTSLEACLFDGYCDYVDQIELEYQQTEEYQNIRRRLDEYETAIQKHVSSLCVREAILSLNCVRSMKP